ncbi:MAG TPA: diguanylate cyclase [Candidatus Acidoferrum sp.]|nr:diguanylate cyclase [Candidatus Acidoferrum sp.]
MSDPGLPSGMNLPAEDSFYNLLIDTLEGLDQPARGLFLQKLLKSLTQLDFTESLSLEIWERILDRRAELKQLVGRPVALKTAMMDVLTSSNYLRQPVLMEYEELKKLQVNAATDPLTGLYNRRLFEEYFEKELNRSRRYDLSLALITLDLHMFKDVNDRFGHPRGDEVLRLAANTLRHSMRTSDYAFRIGGDEFALLLPQADSEQAGTLGRRIHTNFAAVLQPQRMDLPLGLDYGLAVYPQDGDQTSILMKIADERLYQMKYANRPQPAPGAAPQIPSRRATDRPQPSTAELRAAAGGPGQVIPPPPPKPPVETGAAARKSNVERRRWERISLAGKKAFATVSNGGELKLRVLDMSHGGVALEAEGTLNLGDAFHAVLHVPILPATRVRLKKLYSLPASGPQSRVGCQFIV